MQRIKDALNKFALKIYFGFEDVKKKTNDFMTNTEGDAYIDTVIKILIAVVVGALLLWGIYKLMESTVMPQLEDKIKSIFDNTQTKK